MKDNIRGHLSLSKKKEKKNEHHNSTLMCDVRSSPTNGHGGAYHCHDDLAHPTLKSQVTCQIMQVSNKKNSLIERMKLSLEIIELTILSHCIFV